MKVDRFDVKWVGPTYNGYKRVQRRDGKWNLIDGDNNLICKEWYHYVWDVEEGFAVVQREPGLENFVSVKTGERLNDCWYHSAERFVNGFGHVYINSKRHLVTPEGYVN